MPHGSRHSPPPALASGRGHLELRRKGRDPVGELVSEDVAEQRVLKRQRTHTCIPSLRSQHSTDAGGASEP